MSIYKITKGQLITIWIFGILLFLGDLIYVSDSYTPSGFALSMLAVIPAALIFYTLGWKKANSNESIGVRSTVKYFFDRRKYFYKSLGIVGLIILVLIIAGSFIYSDLNEDFISENSDTSNIDLSKYGVSSKTCEADVSSLEQVNKIQYKMYSLDDSDRDIKFESNDIKITGVIKNDSECVANEIYMKITLKDSNNSDLIQEEIVSLKKNGSDYIHPRLTLYPSSTGEFLATITAFNSLAENINNNYGFRSGTRLKKGVTITTEIHSANWLSRN